MGSPESKNSALHSRATEKRGTDAVWLALALHGVRMAVGRSDCAYQTRSHGAGWSIKRCSLGMRCEGLGQAGVVI